MLGDGKRKGEGTTKVKRMGDLKKNRMEKSRRTTVRGGFRRETEGETRVVFRRMEDSIREVFASTWLGRIFFSSFFNHYLYC